MAPGSRGCIHADAFADKAALGEAYLAASAHAYGQGLEGASDAPGFAARVAGADGFVHQQDHAEIDLLDGLDFAAFEGGFAAAAEALGAAPALYHVDTSRNDAPRVRLLQEEIARVVRGRAANPAWIAGMMRHGYRGAAEIGRALDGLYAFAATVPGRFDAQFDLMFEATLGDPEVDAFLHRANPAAHRAMLARFRQAAAAKFMAQPAQQRGRAVGGSMSAARVRGWCPSLFEPMAAGDGFLVRVKPHVGGVSAAQLRVLAAAAERFGSGRIEITNRANFQLRGFSLETVPGFAAAMLEAGLASADPAVERRRNIFVSLSADPIGMALARQLEDWLEREAGLVALPAKFGFAVGEVAADINILPGRDAPVVVLPGGFTVVAPAPLQAVQALTQAFLRQAERITPRPARMRALLAAIGAEAVFAEAGLRMERVAPAYPAPGASVGKMPDAFGLGLAFGVQDGAMLRRAAELAERFGNGVLRTTRARSLVVMGVGETPASRRRRRRWGSSPSPAMCGCGSRLARGGRPVRMRSSTRARWPRAWLGIGRAGGCCMSRPAPKVVPRRKGPR